MSCVGSLNRGVPRSTWLGCLNRGVPRSTGLGSLNRGVPRSTGLHSQQEYFLSTQYFGR